VFKKLKLTKFSLGIILTVFISIFLWNPPTIHALSCSPYEAVYVSAFEHGQFIDGFAVKYKWTRNACDSRPIVIDNFENIENIVRLESQILNREISSGIYQLSTFSNCQEFREWCAERTKLELLSLNPAELTEYKSKWQKKESAEYFSILLEKWSVTFIVVGIVGFFILWPWILIKVRPNLQKQLPWLLFLAIFLQFFLLFYLYVETQIYYGSYGLWQATKFISISLLILTIIIELMIIITRMMKSKKFKS